MFREKLTDSERALFDQGQLVTRGNVVEGHRVYAAFHPPAFLRHLFNQQSDILEHREGKQAAWGLEQDLWVLRKR